MAALGCIAALAPSFVHADDRVAVFAVGDDPKGAELAALVREQVKREGWGLAMPTTRPAPTPIDSARLSELKAIGSKAIQDLAGAAEGDGSLLERYEPSIRNALQLTSAATDEKARGVLWNLCILELQLRMLEGGSARPAALACRRRFPKQWEFSHIWAPEVVRAFRSETRELDTVSLEIKSTPAGCDVLLYGAAVGTTPTTVSVQKGRQEVQIRCATDDRPRYSRVHELNLTSNAELVVHLEGDRAFRSKRLVYSADSAKGRALDHALALAAEAGASSFVLIVPHGDGWHFQWVSSEGGRLLGETRPSTADTTASIETLFNGLPPPPPTSATDGERYQPSRNWRDVSVGAGLLVAAAAAAAYPITTITRQGECENADCSSTYGRPGAVSWALVGASSLLVGAGTAVLWAAPFGRAERVKLTLGIGGLRIRGTF